MPEGFTYHIGVGLSVDELNWIVTAISEKKNLPKTSVTNDMITDFVNNIVTNAFDEAQAQNGS